MYTGTSTAGYSRSGYPDLPYCLMPPIIDKVLVSDHFGYVLLPCLLYLPPLRKEVPDSAMSSAFNIR